jgi:two-component system response regulator FixJ
MNNGRRAIIYIVDDDSAMRDSLLALVEAESLEAREYGSAKDFLTGYAAESERPECVVLDIRMPDINGIELLRTLRTNQCDIPVLLVSGHADVPATIRGMKLGAVDLLQKPVDPSVFIDAIWRSLKISQDMKLEQAEAAAVSRRFEHLTTRELELLELIVDGQSSKQIAIKLTISVKTVANHRTNMMAKTGAANPADLARLFTRFKANISRRAHSHATERNRSS